MNCDVMLEAFERYIDKHALIESSQSTLLAVSGGMDSVVMVELFRLSGRPFGIAHCNFQLRGRDSDADADFVENLAESLAVPFFSARFDTEKVAAQRKLSIQMAARELRYGWLEQIRRQQGFDWVATAHHLDDSIETLLYNFVKGSGLKGLLGIPRRNGKVIRPLLFATKAGLTEFAGERGLVCRQDASNLEEKYARNKLRLQVVPVLTQLNPRFTANAGETIDRLRDAAWLYDLALDHLRKQLVQYAGHQCRIDLAGLKALEARNTVLFELIKDFGFTPGQVHQILDGTSGHSGPVFYSSTHRLLIDRGRVIVEPVRKEDPSNGQVLIPEEATRIILKNGELQLERQSGQPEQWPEEPTVALLDLQELSFPLRLRHWRAGDWFCPLGMDGKRQKLQDFFSNRKITRFEKERIWILETEKGDICWVVGHRIDDRFRIKKDTHAFLKVEFIGQP